MTGSLCSACRTDVILGKNQSNAHAGDWKDRFMPKLFFALSAIAFIIFAFRVNVRMFGAVKRSRFARFSRNDRLSDWLYSRTLSASWMIDVMGAAASFALALGMAVLIGGPPG
jgi:hypothetical protein